MSVKNAYTELPEISCVVTSVPMEQINAYINTIPYPETVREETQVIIRNETGNGKSFLCNNGCGQQADGGKLPSKWIPFITATFIKKENMTGNLRRFTAFKDWHTTIDLVAERVMAKGMYIGEKVDSNYYKGDVKTIEDAAVAYWDEWVVGDHSKPKQEFINDFVSMYKQAQEKIV
jgi:hypothetical protein